MQRRHFLRLSAWATAGAAIAPLVPYRAMALRGDRIKPARLTAGDAVGIISPATAAFLREDVEIVLEAVRALGLEPVLGEHVFDRYGYLAGQDRDRAADINRFFADPAIKALIPVQGGWGSSRVLPYLDYDLIRENPKILVGFSDITALLMGITGQTGLVTFHGPNGLSGWRSQEVDMFRRVLFNGEAVTFSNRLAGVDSDRLMQVSNRTQTITAGQARGTLVGGNLSVLSGIVGSPYMPDLTGAILFLEDVGESIYRIDRMMTQLALAGVFDNLAGFIFGQCTRCGPDADYGSLTLEEVVWDHLEPRGIPAWYGAAIGHLEPLLTLPVGLEVEIDATAATIQMTESAVT
ncbi:MAG: LD-carboxypeptidase [Synechococcales cyanobacterium K44_A2020_017]|nr:LD-carboxypeptidase [Synechococcales cyanobacterium K32_A2020_035]MBF2094287.1 LD-carboxypeptidase [Synechococcales cyanobacterium K44_A2020_017]